MTGNLKIDILLFFFFFQKFRLEFMVFFEIFYYRALAYFWVHDKKKDVGIFYSPKKCVFFKKKKTI